MSSFLHGLLADPKTGEALEFVNEEYFVNRATGDKYPLQNGLPNFLIRDSSAINLSPTVDPHNILSYRDHYEKDAALVDYFEEDEALVTRNERKRNRQAIMEEVPASAGSILDIGCGGAWVAAKFIPKGKNVVSMDISSINPAKAKEKYPQHNHQAIIADAMYLPFKNNSIDCIIASEVIEHVPNPEVFVAGILQKLKPGGTLILMTPYNEKIRYHLCVHCNNATPQNGHLHSFTESKIKSVIPSSIASSRPVAFCNNYLLKLRVYNVLAFLPFNIWKMIDKIANIIARKPLSLLTVVTKK